TFLPVFLVITLMVCSCQLMAFHRNSVTSRSLSPVQYAHRITPFQSPCALLIRSEIWSSVKASLEAPSTLSLMGPTATLAHGLMSIYPSSCAARNGIRKTLIASLIVGAEWPSRFNLSRHERMSAPVISRRSLSALLPT